MDSRKPELSATGAKRGVRRTPGKSFSSRRFTLALPSIGRPGSSDNNDDDDDEDAGDDIDDYINVTAGQSQPANSSSVFHLSTGEYF